MDSIDDLLAGLLERPDVAWREGLDELCREHPEQASELRRRFAHLERLGITAPTAAPAAADAIPERFGNYRLVRQLGSGGMGIVWLAIDESLQREVALKMIRPERMWFDNAHERFRREVGAVARLRHPGCVQILQVGEVGDVPFFAMEHIPGASCDQVVKMLRETGLPPARLGGRDLAATLRARNSTVDSGASELFAGSWTEVAVRIALAAAEALAHAHARRVVHRDLKLGNLMLTPEGRVVIIDFGLALAEGSSPLTRQGALLGSVPYMAPEQLRGEAEAIGEATDVYALGVCLHELLALAPAFAASNEQRLRGDILAGARASLRQHNPEVGGDLEVVVARATHLDRERRYPSASHLAADLAAVLQDRPIQARRDALGMRVLRWARQHRAIATALALLLLGALVLPTAISLAIASQRDQALIARQAARQRAHAANVAAASAALLAGNGEEARLRLEACPEDLRAFEWQHLQLALDESLLQIDTGSEPITALAAAADGSLVAAGCKDGRVALCDISRGIRLVTFAATDQSIEAIGFAADSSELFVVDERQTLRVFAVATRELLRERPIRQSNERLLLPIPVDRILCDRGAAQMCVLDAHSFAAGPVVSLAIDAWPKRRYLLGGDEIAALGQGGIELWQLDGSRRANLPVDGSHELRGASPGLQHFAVVGPHLIEVWRRDGERLATIDRRGRNPLSALFLDGNRWVALPCLSGEVLAIELATGSQSTLLGPRGGITAAAALGHAASFVTGDAEGKVRRWDCRVKNSEQEFPLHGFGRGIGVSGQGHLLTGTADAVLRATDVATGMPVWTVGHGHWVNAIAVLPGKDTVVSALQAWLRFHGERDGRDLGSMPIPDHGMIARLVMLPERSLLACASRTGDTALIDVEQRSVKANTRAHDGWVTGLWWDAKRQRLWSCGVDGKLQYIDPDRPDTPTVIARIDGEFLSLDGDESHIYTSEATHGGAGRLCERDIASGAELRHCAVADAATVVRRLGAERLVSGSRRGHITFWDRQALVPVLDLQRFPDEVLNLVVSPDAAWVAAIAVNGPPLVLRASADKGNTTGSVDSRVRLAHLTARAVAAMTPSWRPWAERVLRADPTLSPADANVIEVLLPPANRWSIAWSGRQLFGDSVPVEQRERHRVLFECLREAITADIDHHGDATRIAYALGALRMGEPAVALRVLADVHVDPTQGPEDTSGDFLPDLCFARGMAHCQLGDRDAAGRQHAELAALVAGKFANEERARFFLRELSESLQR